MYLDFQPDRKDVFTVSKAMDPQLQTMIDNMPEKTGKSLSDWIRFIGDRKLEKHGDIMKLLKTEHGVTHGFANTITLLYREQLNDEVTTDESMVDGMYAGPKAGLKSIYDAILAGVSEFGKDLEISPKKTYVSLRRSKQFAIVKPSTKTRIDLGLNLKGDAPAGRLEVDKVFSGMCSHCVRLTAADDVDEELLGWLRRAFDRA